MVSAQCVVYQYTRASTQAFAIQRPYSPCFRHTTKRKRCLFSHVCTSAGLRRRTGSAAVRLCCSRRQRWSAPWTRCVRAAWDYCAQEGATARQLAKALQPPGKAARNHGSSLPAREKKAPDRAGRTPARKSWLHPRPCNATRLSANTGAPRAAHKTRKQNLNSINIIATCGLLLWGSCIYVYALKLSPSLSLSLSLSKSHFFSICIDIQPLSIHSICTLHPGPKPGEGLRLKFRVCRVS